MPAQRAVSADWTVTHTFRGAGGFASAEANDWLQPREVVTVRRHPPPTLAASLAEASLLHLPSHGTEPSSQDGNYARRSSTGLAHPLPAEAATRADTAAEHVTRGHQISGSGGHVAEVKGDATSDVRRCIRCY